MPKNFIGEKVLLLLAALFFILSSALPLPNLIERTDYISPPLEVKRLAAGFENQSADSFWLRATQDFDYCEKLISENLCKGKSWLYNVINLVVELDSKFLEAHYYGALALTVLVSDYDGASVILDKGAERFKTNWQLQYLAAYHALFEEKNKLKASQLYLAAVENGAPSWVRLMAGRLAGEAGDIHSAKLILNQLIDANSDPAWVKILRKKIRSIEHNSK